MTRMGSAVLKAAPLALVVVALVLCQPACAAGSSFGKLPLTVTVTTPTELVTAAANEPLTISGRQAITAVFSRPIIPLGSDFGKEQEYGGAVPFTISCDGSSPVPGRGRWVTTNIARFDPSVDWPSDLACTFEWNATLSSYDGAPLQLSSPRQVSLRTEPLKMTLGLITSELANNLTDNNWSPREGKRIPEPRILSLTPNLFLCLCRLLGIGI